MPPDLASNAYDDRVQAQVQAGTQTPPHTPDGGNLELSTMGREPQGLRLPPADNLESSGRAIVAENSGRAAIAESSGRAAVDNSGRSPMENCGRSPVESSGRVIADNSGRAVAESSGRTAVDSSGRTVVESSGRAVVDNSGRPGTESSAQLASENTVVETAPRGPGEPPGKSATREKRGWSNRIKKSRRSKKVDPAKRKQPPNPPGAAAATLPIRPAAPAGPRQTNPRGVRNTGGRRLKTAVPPIPLVRGKSVVPILPPSVLPRGPTTSIGSTTQIEVRSKMLAEANQDAPNAPSFMVHRVLTHEYFLTESGGEDSLVFTISLLSELCYKVFVQTVFQYLVL